MGGQVSKIPMEEASEQNSVPKPHTDEGKPTQLGLGLGFQPRSSVDPDPNIDSIRPPSSDLDQKTPNEEHHTLQSIIEELQNEPIVDENDHTLQSIIEELQNEPIVDEDHHTLQSIIEELQNEQIVEEERHNLESVMQSIIEELQNEQIVDQEHHTLQSVSEELRNEQIVDQEHHTLLPVSQVLQNQQYAEEELKNLSLEEKEQVSEKVWDREGDVEDEFQNWETLSEELRYQRAIEGEIRTLILEEKEKFNRGLEVVDGEGRNENEEDKGQGGGVEYGSENNDDGNRSENEKGYDGDGNENVEGEIGSMAGSKEDGKMRKYHYPVRPDAEDCPFYMRTGACKFGSNCKFNHPLRRKNQAAKEKVKDKEESPERQGQTDCKYYSSSGGCKYGKACRYKHSMRKAPVAPIVEFNFLGLPIRLGEKECPFYMRNGSCKYGSNCRFNHPDPTAVGGGDALSGYGNDGSLSLHGPSQSPVPSWPSTQALNETGPFVPGMFPPTQRVPLSNPERNGYQGHGKYHVYPAPPERRLPTPPAFSPNGPPEINFYTHHKHQMPIDEFPERPGQPECSFFLKTGDCKYKSSCKFHHPKYRLPKTAIGGLNLSDNGLPQRPDQNICSHYKRYGICKFGPACKFDHPVTSGNSSSSSPAFVAPDNQPFPFGNSASSDDGWQ